MTAKTTQQHHNRREPQLYYLHCLSMTAKTQHNNITTEKKPQRKLRCQNESNTGTMTHGMRLQLAMAGNSQAVSFVCYQNTPSVQLLESILVSVPSTILARYITGKEQRNSKVCRVVANSQSKHSVLLVTQKVLFHYYSHYHYSRL